MSSISQVTEATVQLVGRMVVGVFSESSGEYKLYKASGLTFLEPGQYVMDKFNLEKNRDQRV